MKANTKRKALIDLTDHMETFLDNFSGDMSEFPWIPSVTAELMAEHAFSVLEILTADQDDLRENGLLKEEKD